jgi:ectoine hydroxylase-related dioxygenase (phytanoyl-CoA dioxygenase family)
VLTVAQRAEFAHTGLLRLPGAIPVGDADAMVDRVWSSLFRQTGIDRNDPTTWTTTQPTGFQPLSRAGLDEIWSPAVRAAIEDLMGTGDVHREHPRVLMTFPDSDESPTIPSAGWHLDYVPPQAAPGLRALQVFVVLDDVLPGGGGTVVLTGSHRLVGNYLVETGSDPRPKLVRLHYSATDPWLADLWTSPPSDATKAVGPGMSSGRDRRLRDGALLDGVPLRVVEATGAAGDVYLMHSDCFHAVAVNARPTPRIMATSVVTRKSS